MTLHGHNLDDLAKLKEFFDSEVVVAAAISKEFGKTKTSPHWQVYYELSERTGSARSDMIEILGHDGFHLEKAKGTKESNVAYVFASDGSHKIYEMGIVMYRKNVNTPWGWDPSIGEYWENFKPRPFQSEILEIIKKDWKEEKRKIYWFYDHGGNTGKTAMAEYLHIYHGAIVTGGTAEDMKHAVSRWQETAHYNPKVIIADVSRGDGFNRSSAKGIEAIKNGLFFDGKYESAMVHSRVKPHVLIFANFEPDRELLSKDRWQVYKIDEKTYDFIKE